MCCVSNLVAFSKINKLIENTYISFRLYLSDKKRKYWGKYFMRIKDVRMMESIEQKISLPLHIPKKIWLNHKTKQNKTKNKNKTKQKENEL